MFWTIDKESFGKELLDFVKRIAIFESYGLNWWEYAITEDGIVPNEDVRAW